MSANPVMYQFCGREGHIAWNGSLWVEWHFVESRRRFRHRQFVVKWVACLDSNSLLRRKILRPPPPPPPPSNSTSHNRSKIFPWNQHLVERMLIVQTYERSESARERRTALYKSDHQQQQCQSDSSFFSFSLSRPEVTLCRWRHLQVQELTHSSSLLSTPPPLLLESRFGLAVRR